MAEIRQNGLPSRLKAAADIVGGPDELARRTSIRRRTLGDYLSGASEPKASALKAISAVTKIAIDWLVTGRGPKHPQYLALTASGELEPFEPIAEEPAVYQVPAALEGRYVFVPRHEVRAAAGAGSVVTSEQVVDYLAFKAEWIRSLGLTPQRLSLIEAAGDSMEPTIRPSDLLLLDIGIETVKQNAIYVVSVAGELVVKRLQRLFDGTVIMSSDNPAYQPEQLTADEAATLHIVGRVIWIGRQI
ncbi:MAG: helix-turn-helix transcriptional regulator [Alphaproteobacteria bacterium]